MTKYVDFNWKVPVPQVYDFFLIVKRSFKSESVVFLKIERLTANLTR